MDKDHYLWANGHLAMGVNGDTEYKYLGVVDDIEEVNKDTLEDILSDLSDYYNYSDKYRGIDYELVNTASKEWLNDTIERNVRRIERYRKENSILRDILLKDVGKNTDD